MPKKKRTTGGVISHFHIAVAFCSLGPQFFSDMQGCFSNSHSQCWCWRHQILTKYIRQRYWVRMEEAVAWHDRCPLGWRGPERDGQAMMELWWCV